VHGASDEQPPTEPVATTRHTPLVFAHRGASSTEPEHTLSAYMRAIDQGADGLECDVRLTADGHLVCVHDRSINRTSSGRGLVSTLELADLEGLDWGSWKAAHPDADEMPDRDRNRLLTLRRLLIVAGESQRPLGLLIETKHPTRYAGLVERRLAKLLADLGLDGPAEEGRVAVSMMSFSHLALLRMRQLSPQLSLVYLMERSVPIRFRDGSLPRGVHTAGLDIDIVRTWPRTVAHQQARGHRVYVWTVDDPADVQLCQELGVDGLITNRPLDVIDQIRSIG
jgi:glycerophosphoryl diester phosphodiesterase